MKLLKAKNILCALSAFFALGCLKSPLFNHAEADQEATAGQTRNQLPSVEECPLEFVNSGLCAALVWIQVPNEDEKGKFNLRFWKKEEPQVHVTPENRMVVKLWMPSMGHGSSPVVVTQDKDVDGNLIAGEYTVSEVYFVMGGEWEIKIQLKDSAQHVVDQAIFPFQF
jgi:hypothetical protein